MKTKHQFALLALVCLGGLADASLRADCLPPPTGLVSWWRAEGNANDSVGTNHGTLQNDATFGVGRVGQAFRFSGADAAVSVADAPALHFTNQFTLESWVNPTNLNNNPMVFSKFNGANSSYELHLQPGGSLRANITGDGLNYDVLVSGPALIAVGAWSHVATTFNSGTWRLFINGVEVASTTSFVTTIFAGTANLLIGRDVGTTHTFNGLIDEPAVYNRALTTNEVQAIFNAGPAGKCLGTPTLSIARTTTNTVAVFWPSLAASFTLQQNTNSVASVNWSNVVTTPSDDGTTKTVIINPPTGNRYYRLFKP